MARSAMQMPIYTPEPEFKGLGIVGKAQAAAESAAAPAMQASQFLQQQQQQSEADAKTKAQAAQFQKLLQTGVQGMQGYVQEISGTQPELGQRFAAQLQNFAPLLSDPNIKREKAWEMTSWIYDSWDKQVREADKTSAEAKAKAEMENEFANWNTQSIAEQEKLGYKLADSDINRIASIASPKLKSSVTYQKAIDDLRKKTVINAASATSGARQDRSQIIGLENTLRDEFNKKTASTEAAATAFRKLSQALERNNPADAYSAIINYVRTLDPGSTVREAEERLARERSAGGPLGALGQQIENLKGGKLTDPIRKNLFEAGKGLVMSELESYRVYRSDYASRVQEYIADNIGIKESRVLGKDLAAEMEKELGRDIFKGKEIKLESLSSESTDNDISAYLKSKGKKASPENIAAVRKARGG